LIPFSVLSLPFGETTIPVQTDVPQVMPVACTYHNKLKDVSLQNRHKINAEWEMVNGEWGMGNGEWEIRNSGQR